MSNIGGVSLAVLAILALNAVAEPTQRNPTTDWLKIYPSSPYRETWTADLEVKSTAEALPRVVQALEKASGQPIVPLANTISSQSAGTQQLIYRFTKKHAEAALKGLRKIGKLPAPLKRPSGDVVPLPELKQKVADLSRDKQEHTDALAAMPAVSALVDAMLGHLLTVQQIAEKVEQEVVLNLTIRQQSVH